MYMTFFVEPGETPIVLDEPKYKEKVSERIQGILFNEEEASDKFSDFLDGWSDRTPYDLLRMDEEQRDGIFNEFREYLDEKVRNDLQEDGWREIHIDITHVAANMTREEFTQLVAEVYASYD